MNLSSRPLNLKLTAAIFLFIVAILQYFVLVQYYLIPVQIAFADAILGIGLLYVFLLVLPFRFNYFLPKFLSYFAIGIQSLLMAAAWVSICKNVLISFFPEHHDYGIFWQNTFLLRGFVTWLIIYDYYLFSFIFAKINKEKISIENEQQLLQLQKDGELFKLRQQLQPHFLFNSLNSINALIGINAEQARKMVQQLSNYLRNNLKKEDADFVRFDEELQDLKLYLSIEQIRFGDRLLIEESINAECFQLSIPPFLLQPLIENAIKHGLYETIGKVTIKLNARLIKSKEYSELEFSVSNPHDAQSINTSGTGFGLNSIKRRLYLLFLRNDLLKIEHKAQEFIATIKIPVKNEDENNPY